MNEDVIVPTGPRKVHEWEERPGFAGGWFSRVRPLADGEAVPRDAVEVSADTPDRDWERGVKH